MAVLQIRLEGDPVLRAKAAPVPKITKRIAKLLKDMEETMYAAEGVGLAAPQVGVSLRMFVADAGDGPMVFVNPVLVEGRGSQVDSEGCLSIPGVYGYVERYESVVVTAEDAKGKPRRVEASGLLARVIQHEMDHLDGILFTDKATGITRPGDPHEQGAGKGTSAGRGADLGRDARAGDDAGAAPGPASAGGGDA